jgi:hypothetical protein
MQAVICQQFLFRDVQYETSPKDELMVDLPPVLPALVDFARMSRHDTLCLEAAPASLPTFFVITVEINSCA